MTACNILLTELTQGTYDARLAQLYALDGTDASLAVGRARVCEVTRGFLATFNHPEETPVTIFTAPGRTEIGGNHTDHQQGCVLCASVDLDMLACAAPNGTSVVNICSQGYPTLSIDITDLSVRAEDENTSPALVRGVVAGIASMGHEIHGFDAYMTSTVLGGSGLSSSAAYEVLVGNMVNHLFCGDALSAIELAKIGQYAENVHFGKPSGLMDQMGSSVGGAVAINFGDAENPIVTKVEFDFASVHHALCIVDTKSDHADLTGDYGDIPREMCAVAQFFSKTKLHEVDENEFLSNIAAVRKVTGDRAVLRAIHFYDDNRKAQDEAAALQAGDFETFLRLVNASGISSANHLQNIWVARNPQQQAVTLSLAMGAKLLDGAGAIRVHGGGFAGTIQAFVPYVKLDTFKAGMDALLGKGACHVLHIRPEGGCVVI